MSVIIKKIVPEWFDAIASGKKKFELRLSDFQIGEDDILRLEEWIGEGKDRKPTGRFLEKKVNYVRKVDLKSWIKEQPELVEKGFYVIQLD